MNQKILLHSMTFLGEKPGSDTSLPAACIRSSAFSPPEKLGDGGRGCSRKQDVTHTACGLPPHFLKAAKTYSHPSNQSLRR